MIRLTSIPSLFLVLRVDPGGGRTGEWWAVNHSDIVPDILVFAKGIGSGEQHRCFPLRLVGKA